MMRDSRPPTSMKKMRKKRRSKYDIPNIYEGSSSQPYFNYQPGHSKFYNNHGQRMTHDPSLNLRPQKDRTVFTDEQMFILERAYQRDKHPNPDVRLLVAELTALSAERVRIWYQNRRAKEKRDQEDELAYLAEKMRNNSSSGYDQQPYPCRSTLNQKLNELNRIFSSKHSTTSKSNNENSDTINKYSELSSYARHHSDSKSSERDIVKQLIREGGSSTYTKRSKSSSKNNEYKTVKNVVLKPSEPKLPGIESFSTYTTHGIADQHRVYHKERSRKRTFCEPKDVDEAKCIQDLIKRGSNCSTKKLRREGHGSVKEYRETTNPTLDDFSAVNNELHNALADNHSLLNSSLEAEKCSNDPFITPTADSNGFSSLFTPSQLNILQLLNQRSILEQFQRFYNSNSTTFSSTDVTKVDQETVRQHQTNLLGSLTDISLQKETFYSTASKTYI